MRNTTAQKLLALSEDNKILALEIVGDIRSAYELNKNSQSYKISLTKPDLIVELGADWMKRMERATELFNVLVEYGIVTGQRILDDENLKENGGLDLEFALDKRKFEQLIAGLGLSTSQYADASLFEPFTLNLTNRTLSYGDSIHKFSKSKTGYIWVAAQGVFRSHPKPYILDMDEMERYDLTDKNQSFTSAASNLNDVFRKISGSDTKFISVDTYTFTALPELTLILEGSDPLDFASQV